MSYSLKIGRISLVDQSTGVTMYNAEGQEWWGLPYEAAVAIQHILHDAQGRMVALGDAAVKLKATPK